MAATEPINKPLRLMIVDDSNIIRRKIERSTEGSRFQVVGTAKNGVEALEVFQQCTPEAVTMDITMPEMDGIACIDRLVALQPSILILVVSALADKSIAIESIKKGANGFLCKPFTDRQLNEALAELWRGASHG
jgi:two-component system chemotaxis response regulator CheY